MAKTRMDKETLVKRKRQYGWGVIILTLALYGIGQMGDLIIAQGGTDNTSATILVWLNGIFSFGVLFCIVIWFSDWQQLRRISGPRKEQRKPRNTQAILIRLAIIVAIIVGLVFIFDKIEIHLSALLDTKEGCAKKILENYASELKPDDLLTEHLSIGGRLPSAEVIWLSNMKESGKVIPAPILINQMPKTRLRDIITFPIDSSNPVLIEGIIKSGKCNQQPFICYKGSSCGKND